MAVKPNLMSSASNVPYAGATAGEPLAQDSGSIDSGNLDDNYCPEGYDTPEDYVQDCVKTFNADAAYDRMNREAALDDLKFIAGEQWDPTVKAARLEQGRPCLMVNVLPTFIAQVIGDRRMNKTSIVVKPRKDATVEMAEIRSGLIKSIEAYSRAERVYDSACEDQVSCGISNMRVDLDYADNDVFEQDIFIRHIANPLGVIWDFMSIDITGRDANHCFVQDIMPRKVYDDRWGKKFPCPGEIGDDMTNTLMSTGWFDKDVVRITEHWRMIERKRKLALMQDGKVVDVTDLQPEQWEQGAYRDPQTGQPRIRDSIVTYAQMHLITGFDILEGPYELKLTRLPIIRVLGREVRVGDDRVRYSLIRFAKDAQRLKNYWRSVSAETLALAPKAQWIAPTDAVDGLQDEFRNAHKSGDPLLVYNKNASAAPERVMPAPVSAAVLNEANMNQQDIKDTTGLNDASLGIRSNEISGRAIKARQSEGDIATVVFHDNLNSSIMEVGDVASQLIPVAYDTIRTVRTIGADDKHKLMVINDPNNKLTDMTVGKYDVSIETGPSFATQRQEAADSMMQAIQVAPQLMQIAGDLIVKAQDWPGAQEIAERLKKTVPPQLLSDDDPDKPDPNQPNPAQQEQQQQMELQQTMLAEEFKHTQGVRQLEIAQHMAKVTEAEANAAAAQAAVPKANADAEAAQANAEKARAEAIHAPLKHAQDINHAERAALAREHQARSAGSQPGAGRGKPAAPQKGKPK